jgi:flagellar protein FliS
MTSNPLKAYSKANHTAAKTRQVVMLYDGAIRFLLQAQEAMEANAIEQRYNKLTKAAEVVMGLQSCLDFETGGDAAKILYDFYASVDMRIIALHRSNDAQACEALITELRQMRDVWEQIDRGVAQQQTPPATSPAATMPVSESTPSQAKTVTVSA